MAVVFSVKKHLAVEGNLCHESLGPAINKELTFDQREEIKKTYGTH